MNRRIRSLSMPADWWEAFERQAGRAGVSLSEWAGDILAAELPDRERRKLSKRRARGWIKGRKRKTDGDTATKDA